MNFTIIAKLPNEIVLEWDINISSLQTFYKAQRNETWIEEALTIDITDEHGVVWLEYRKPEYNTNARYNRWYLFEQGYEGLGIYFDTLPRALRSSMSIFRDKDKATELALCVRGQQDNNIYLYMRLK